MQNHYQQGEWIKLYWPIYTKINETHVYRTDNAFGQIQKQFSKNFSAKKHSSCYKVFLIWMKVNYFKVFLEDFLPNFYVLHIVVY